MGITTISGPFGQELRNALTQIVAESGEDLVAEDGTPIISEDDIALTTGSGNGACCPQTIVEFNNVSKTVIAYSSELIQKHGRTPRVETYYYQVDQDGNFIIGGAYTRKSLIGIPTQQVVVDHGGISTGFIKLS